MSTVTPEQEEAEQIAQKVLDFANDLIRAGHPGGLVGLSLMRVGMDCAGRAYGSGVVTTWMAEQVGAQLRVLNPRTSPRLRQ